MKTPAFRVVLKTRGAIDAYVSSMDFEFRPLALEVLELLTACCFRGGSLAVWQVQQGFATLGVRRGQKQYGVLIAALLSQDVELQQYILTFLNTLIMHEPSIGQRFTIRYALQELRFMEVSGYTPINNSR
jgi:hypothetical protein